MNVNDFKRKAKEIHKKWHFNTSIIGGRLGEKSKDERTTELIDLVNEYIAELHKEEFNTKTKEQQFKVVENTINLVVDDMGIYTMPNWKQICEKVRSESYEEC